MKIAIDARVATHVSGVGVATEHMIRHLLEIDQKNEYLIIGNDAVADPPPNCSSLRTPWRLTNHPAGDLWFHLRLPAILMKENVDVFWGPGYLVPLGGSGFRRVVTFCDLSFHQAKSTFPLSTRSYFRLMFRQTARKADRIIAISDFTKSEIGRCYGPKCLAKTRVIPLDCSDAFRAIGGRRLNANEKFGIVGPYILFVGNLEPRKNLAALIEAFRQIKRAQAIPHQLVIVGQKAWMYRDVFRSIRTAGLERDVVLTGYVDQADLPGLYAGADVFVYPSLYEGFGIPILEAMAVGVPVIASNRASIPEVAGDAAMLCDPEDPVALGRAMLRVLESPALREDMRAKGTARVAQFSWRRSAQRLLQEIEARG